MAGLPHQASEAYGSEGYGDAYAYGSEAAAAPLGAGAGVGAGAGADDPYGHYGGDDAYAYGAYFTQVVSLPAGLVHGIMSFLTGNDLRALGATCTSALALACEHITHLTVRVPKTKLLQPMFRTTLPRYGAVTHITGAVRVWVLEGVPLPCWPVACTCHFDHVLPDGRTRAIAITPLLRSPAPRRTSYGQPGVAAQDSRGPASGVLERQRHRVAGYERRRRFREPRVSSPSAPLVQRRSPPLPITRRGRRDYARGQGTGVEHSHVDDTKAWR